MRRLTDNAEFIGEYFDEEDGDYKAEYAMFGEQAVACAPNRSRP